MRYGLFLGCNIPARIEGYGRCAEKVLTCLDCTVVTLSQFTCCGYPVRNVDQRSYLLPSVRNMALAEKEGLDLLVLCNCCYHSLQKAKHTLDADPSLVSEFNSILQKEGLKYHGTCRVQHLYSVLHDDIGVDVVGKRLLSRFTGLEVCVIQGCHLLRPREVVGFDDSFIPKVTASLLDILGVKSLQWDGELECCGAALAGINEELSVSLLEEKLNAAIKAKADLLVSSCSYCFLQLDRKQGPETQIPVMFYLQLLGLAMGLSDEDLGFETNHSIASELLDNLKNKLSPVS